MDYIPFLAREQTLLEKATTLITQPFNIIWHPFQTLASLPALTFFIIPAFSSYSTTFNFLFFYMTWAILIRSNSPLVVELVGTLAVRILFYLLPSAAFLAFDGVLPEIAKGLKEHGEDALALGEAQGGLRGRWWKIAAVSVGNVSLGVLLQVGIDAVLLKVLGFKSAIRITTTPPFPWRILKDLILGLLIREVLTYVVHRYALHGRRSRVRTQHRKWQHSILSPFSFVAHYDHPLPYLLHVFLPTYLPAVILRMHLLSYNMYLAVVSVEETFAYSGYNVLPTAFILGGIARRQERHFLSKGTGNYGCFGLVDFFMGTSLGEDLLEDVVDEAEDKQVARRAKGKAKGVKGKVQRRLRGGHDEDAEDSDATASTSATSRSRSRRPTRGRNAKHVDEDEDFEQEKPKRKPPKLARRSKKQS